MHLLFAKLNETTVWICFWKFVIIVILCGSVTSLTYRRAASTKFHSSRWCLLNKSMCMSYACELWMLRLRNRRLGKTNCRRSPHPLRMPSASMIWTMWFYKETNEKNPSQTRFLYWNSHHCHQSTRLCKVVCLLRPKQVITVSDYSALHQ